MLDTEVCLTLQGAQQPNTSTDVYLLTFEVSGTNWILQHTLEVCS